MAKPCRKRSHASKGAAIATAKRAHKGEPMNVYMCDRCRAWHLGSSSRVDRVQARFDVLLTNPPKLKWPKAKKGK